MKSPWYETSPGALAALLASGLFVDVDLYRFVLAGQVLGVSELRYGAGTIDVTAAGAYWAANAVAFDAAQARAKAHWKAGLDVDTWQVVAAPRDADPLTGVVAPDKIGTAPWLVALRAGALDGAEVQIDRAFAPDWNAVAPGQGGRLALAPTGIVSIFYGRIAEGDAGRSRAIITINSHLKLIANPMPRRLYQAACIHTLFDAGCMLKAADFAVAGTVAGVSADGATLSATLATPAGSATYALGRLVMQDGASAGFARTIRAWSGHPGDARAHRAIPVGHGARRHVHRLSRLRQAARDLRAVREPAELRRGDRHSRAGDRVLMIASHEAAPCHGVGTEAAERAAVVREALSWAGTAFHHMGQLKLRRAADGRVLDRGGADCAYATLLIYRAAVPQRVPAMAFGYYAPQWNLSKRGAADERYLATVQALPGVRELAAGEHPLPGDLALFRWGLAWAHGAIVIDWPAIAHANAEAGCFMGDRADTGRLRGRRVRLFSFW